MLRHSRFLVSLVLIASVSVFGAGCAPKNQGKAKKGTPAKKEETTPPEAPKKEDKAPQGESTGSNVNPKKKIQPHDDGGSGLIEPKPSEIKPSIRPSTNLKPVGKPDSVNSGQGSTKPTTQVLPEGEGAGTQAGKRLPLGGASKQSLVYQLKKKGTDSKSCDGDLSFQYVKDDEFQMSLKSGCSPKKGALIEQTMKLTSTCERALNNWDTYESANSSETALKIHFQGYLADSKNPEKLADENDAAAVEKGIVTIDQVEYWYRAVKKAEAQETSSAGVTQEPQGAALSN